MIFKFFKIILICVSFIFLTGFLPIMSLLGPGVTIASTGSIYKASAQYAINTAIEKKTGKNSLDFVREKIDKQNNNIKSLNEELKQLIERRVRLVQKKIEFKITNQ